MQQFLGGVDTTNYTSLHCVPQGEIYPSNQQQEIWILQPTVFDHSQIFYILSNLWVGQAIKCADLTLFQEKLTFWYV